MAKALEARGHTVILRDWAVSHKDLPSIAASCDRIMTTPDGAPSLCDSYGIPRNKIAVVAHAEYDVQRLMRHSGRSSESLDGFYAYGVVSDTLVASSLSMGVTRTPTVLRLGVDRSKFHQPIPKSLTTVGYAASLERHNEYGVEQKRFYLAKECAEAAGLNFKFASNTINRLPIADMPAFYGSIGVLIFPSLQEGAGLPPLEAAAAGRLVIGAPVGHWPRLAYEGLGLLAPLNADAFKKFTIERLGLYKRNPNTFRERCLAARDAAAERDWPMVVDDWIDFLR